MLSLVQFINFNLLYSYKNFSYNLFRGIRLIASISRIRLLESNRTWPKVILLSGAHCSHFCSSLLLFQKLVVTLQPPLPPTPRSLVLKERTEGYTRISRLRKAIKSSIIEPPSFYIRFSKFRNNRQKKGYPRSIKWQKNRLRDLLKYVGLGQVRKEIKSSKSEALGSPIHF